MTVTAQERHTRGRPCPICGGHDAMPRGKEIRCCGYSTLDGKWTFCSRISEGAHHEKESPSGLLYVHLLRDEPMAEASTFEDHTAPARTVAEYNYLRDGALVFQVLRQEPKGFRQRRPNGSPGHWLWNMEGVQRVMYRRDEVAQSDGLVFLVEGEKDADALAGLGLCATTSAGGARGWRKSEEDGRALLVGRDVCIIADRDEEGDAYAQGWLGALAGVAKSVRVARVPSSAGKDSSDWIKAGATAGDFFELWKASEQAEALPDSRSLSLLDVLGQWKAEGKLEHEPTGFALLDEWTGGGPVYGTRWYLVGAPDAGKTAVLVQIAHELAQRGVLVGFLAVDEEPTDILTRLAQRTGHSRQDCESRDVLVMASIGHMLESLPFRMFPSGWTIERCAEEMGAWAKKEGKRAALFVDSIQTASCEAEVGAKKELSERSAVTARATALRVCATKHKLIAIATSEMNRNAYRSQESADKSNDMAAAAESRVIEYSARVMLALRSVAGETDMIEVKVTKNKHGPGGKKFYLKIDRTHMCLNPADTPELKEESKTEAKLAKDIKAVAMVIGRRPGIGVRELRSRSGLGDSALTRALDCLMEEGKVEDRPEQKGNRAFPHYWLVVPVKEELS